MGANLLHVIVDEEGEFVTGGTSRAKRNSKKPLAYSSHRNASLGLHHVDGESKGLEIVPYAPLDDLMGLAFICTSMFPYAGVDGDVEMFTKIMAKYDYVLNDDGELVHKSEL